MSVFEPEDFGSLYGIYVLKGILHMTVIIDLDLKKCHCVSEKRGNGHLESNRPLFLASQNAFRLSSLITAR